MTGTEATGAATGTGTGLAITGGEAAAASIAA